MGYAILYIPSHGKKVLAETLEGITIEVVDEKDYLEVFRKNNVFKTVLNLHGKENKIT